MFSDSHFTVMRRRDYNILRGVTVVLMLAFLPLLNFLGANSVRTAGLIVSFAFLVAIALGIVILLLVIMCCTITPVDPAEEVK